VPSNPWLNEIYKGTVNPLESVGKMKCQQLYRNETHKHDDEAQDHFRIKR